MKIYIKRILILGVILIGVISVKAQQDPLYTQYLNNLSSVNPAYAGSRGTFSVVALHRQQWVGFEGAPQTLTLSMNSPIKVFNVGVGLNLIHDKLGPVQQTGLYADYAYHLNLTRKTKFAMGVKAGFNMFDINLTEALSASPDDHIANYGDRNLFLPNVGVGFYLYSDKFYLGLSSPKLLQNSLTEDQNTLDYVNEEERHYFLIGAMLMDLGEFVKLKPSFITRVVGGAPVSVELTSAFIFYDKLWLGGMYRFGSSFGAFVQFQIAPQLKLGYAYDQTNSRLGNNIYGTHELMVTYDIFFNTKKIISPRFF